ncbi:hypothetical protein IJ425_02395 [bacterium]|nr:hypothetical protein [bacterium]
MHISPIQHFNYKHTPKSSKFNQISFKSTVVTSSEMTDVINHNKQLLKEGKYAEVNDFCRSLEAILERGSKDEAYILRTIYYYDKPTVFCPGGWTRETSIGGLHRSANYRYRNDVKKGYIEDCNEFIIESGKNRIQNDAHDWATEKLTQDVFDAFKSGNFEEVLTEHGIKMWNDQICGRKNIFHHYKLDEDFSLFFHYLIEERQKLCDIPVNDMTAYNEGWLRIKKTIRDFVESEHNAIDGSFKNNHKQILKSTTKEYMDDYPKESKNVNEYRKLSKLNTKYINNYKPAEFFESWLETLNNKDETRLKYPVRKNELANILKNWLNALECHENFITKDEAKKLIDKGLLTMAYNCPLKGAGSLNRSEGVVVYKL